MSNGEFEPFLYIDTRKDTDILIEIYFRADQKPRKKIYENQVGRYEELNTLINLINEKGKALYFEPDDIVHKTDYVRAQLD